MSTITLLHGREPILVQRGLRDAVAAVLAQDPGAQVIEVEAGADDAGAQLRMACSPTLFGDTSVVVLHSLDSADDVTAAVLAEVLADPLDTVHLVVLHPAGTAGNKALVDKVKAAGATVVDCAPLKGARAYREFVSREVASAKRKATPDAIEALLDAVGSDAAMLAGAVLQLVSDVADNPLTADHVRDYFTGVVEVNSYEIADAAWGRREVDARRLLRQLMEGSGTGAGPLTVSAMASGLRSLARVGGLAGASDAAIAREAGIPDWKVRTLREQWSRWSGDQRRLAAAVVALADADGAMKGGVVEDSALIDEQKRHALESLVGTIARRREAG